MLPREYLLATVPF